MVLRKMSWFSILLLLVAGCDPRVPSLPVVGNPAAPAWPGESADAADGAELPDSPWVDELFGRWTVEAERLDGRLAELAAELTDGPAGEQARAVLTDPYARVRIGAAADASARQARLRRLDDVLASWSAENFEARSGELVPRSSAAESLRALTERAAQAAAEQQSLVGPLETLRANLRGESAVTDGLREFLERADAVRSIYGLLIQPRLRPDPVRVLLAERFVADDAGQLVVPRAMRPQLQQELTAAEGQSARLAALVARTRNIAARIPAEHEFREDLRQALSEPLFVAVLAQGVRRGKPGLTPAEVDEALVEELEQSVGRLAGGAASDAKLQEVLEAFRSTQRLAGRLRASAARCAALIAPTDALHRGWREFLPSDVGILAAMTAAPAVTGDAAALLSTSPLGLNIVRDERGRYTVISHGEADLERTLQALRATAASQEVFAARLEELARAVADPELRRLLSGPAGVNVLAEELQAELLARPVDGLTEWRKRWFEEQDAKVAPRAGALAELERLAGQADARLQAAVPPPKIVLDVRQVEFAADAVELLRSSSFYTQRTALGERIYRNEFDDHETIRPFLGFEWPAQQSRDLASFQALLGESKAKYERYAATHRRFVIVIAKTPAWLSRSQDSTAFESLWTKANAVPPRDWDQWSELMRSTARFFKQFQVERYYEIWNEPDSQYWQGTQAEYFELYARTAAAIRAEDPAARIGGASVNRWQGTAGGAKGLEPLNVELVRYAAREGVPLDFVSWHQYSGDPANIGRATDELRAALRAAGVEEEPELYLSEWGIGARDTEFAPALFAEHLAAMLEAGVDLQTTTWEDLEAKADPKAYAPYGLITQQGRRKPEYFAYRFADRLSRNAKAVGVFRAADGQTRAIVGRGANGVYDLLLWRIGASAPLTAALRELKAGGLSEAEVRAYGSAKALEAAVQAERPAQREQQVAFAAARKAYLAQAAQPQLVEISLPGAQELRLISARGIREELRDPRVFAEGTRLVLELEPYELVWLRVRAD
jgi:hypothetical protein